MFSLASQLLPPTSVECCVFANFTGKQYLVVGYRERISFYTTDQNKLRLEFYSRIDGIPQGLATAKMNGKQFLVVQFQDCFSLCTVEKRTLKTASIHYYFREDIINLGIRHQMQNKHKIIVDQQSTCILMPNMDFFTVLPIRNELDDHDKIPYFPSWTMSYKELKLIDVKNVIFLNGYFEPTVAILQDGQPYWQGLEQRDQAFISIMSLNIQKKQFTQLKTYRMLPSTSQFLLAIPNQTGFIYICASGFFIFDKPNINGFGIGVSTYSVLESSKYIDKFELLAMTLDGCQAHFISIDTFILILQNGECWTVKLHSSPRMVSPRVDFTDSLATGAQGSRVTMKKMFSVSILKDIAVSGPLCFLGCCGHSKLLDLKLAAPEPIVLEDIADDDLYKMDIVQPKVVVEKNGGEIEIVDSLHSFAPIRHMATNNPINDASKVVFMAATGTNEESTITFFQQTLPWQVIHSFGNKISKHYSFTIGGVVYCQYQKDNKQILVELSDKLIKTQGNPYKIELKSLFFLSTTTYHVLVNSSVFIFYDLSMKVKFESTHDCSIGIVKIYNDILINLHKNTATVFKVSSSSVSTLFTLTECIDISVVENSIWSLQNQDHITCYDLNGEIISCWDAHMYGNVLESPDKEDDPMETDESTKNSFMSMCVLFKYYYFILLADNDGHILVYKYKEHMIKVSTNLMKLKFFKNCFYNTGSMPDQCILVANKTVHISITNLGELQCHVMDQLSHLKHIQKMECVEHEQYMIVDDLNTILLLEIDATFTIDQPLPYKQLHLKTTVEKTTFHDKSGLIVALTSHRKPTKCPPPLVHNDETDGRKVAPSSITDLTTDIERKPGAFQVEMSKYDLKLLTREGEIIDQSEFEDYFIILDMTALLIETKESSTGKQYIAIAGGLMKGEETQIKGEIHVFDMISVSKDPLHPNRTHKLKFRAKNTFKGVASSLTSVVGNLITTNGFKVMVYKFDGDKLNAIAFYDLHHMVSCIAVVKNYVLATDVYRSATFLAFQEDPYRFFLLGRDYLNLQVEMCNFIIDGNSLGLVELDKYGNLYISSYTPFDIQSQSGQKLLRVADYHLGAQVSKTIKLRKTTIGRNKQYFNMMSFYDGGLTWIAPIQERAFKRLMFMTSKMANTLPHQCGLNPKSYRLSTNTSARLDENPHKNVIDGDFAKEFLFLNKETQQQLSDSIGISKDKYLSDLTTIHDECIKF